MTIVEEDTSETIDGAVQVMRRTGWPADEAIDQLVRALQAGRPRAICYRFVDGKLQGSGEVRPDLWRDQLTLRLADDGHHAEVRAIRNLEPGVNYEYRLPTKGIEALAKTKSTKPAPRRPGPATTHDWHTICGEIAGRCVDLKNGRIVRPKNLEKNMLAWCSDEYDLEPSSSEMREAITRVLDRLGKIKI
jgi:hypothetical protein